MPKNILVGILDWGLGHATRSIPIIRYMLQTQCQIFIAASGPQKKILREAFPSLNFLDPPAYSVKYPTGGRNLSLSILKQIPRLRRVIEDERKWVSDTVSEYGINRIISDNRYGFYATGTPSAIITHQLSPRSGLGAIPDLITRRAHYHFLKPFSEIWIPDLAENGGLAGELSHPRTLPPQAHYIGPLSRLSTLQKWTFGESTFGESTFGESLPGSKRVVVVISGPEPARTEFEAMIRPQLEMAGLDHVLVRGLPEEAGGLQKNELNHVNANTMANLLAGAELVICRSGYSSVMDLVKLKKKALLVPTPGQTEQEYLAHHLQQKKVFPFIEQSEFTLGKALEAAGSFEYKFPNADFEAFEQHLERFINR